MSIKLSFANLFGSAERSALDLPVAGLAGLAVAFAMFTIPDDLLAEAVGATGIANIIAAAQPPLGTTARIVLALAGAIGAFSGAVVLLRWLDRFALRGSAPIAVAEPEAPRIHRADAHPDAPPCRPISASRDLGEPAPPSRPASVRVEPAAPPEPIEPVNQSLGDLMARLERGLARREQVAPAIASVPAGPAMASVPSPSSDRLQNAIEGLRALSVRA